METLIYLALLLQIFIVVKGNAASCPTDFNYVHQFPWDSSDCQSGENDAQCCQALLSLFDIGLAQYLKDSSMFMFPDHASATACVNEFQRQLSSMPLAVPFPAFVPRCQNDVSDFVSSPNLCNGIQTKTNWTNLLGTTAIDLFCKVDLSDLRACGLCFNGAQQVISKLVQMKKNVTEKASLLCLRFSTTYLAAVSRFGPKDPNTASCAFKLPLSLPKSKNKSRLVSISTFAGVAVIVIFLSGFLIVYMVRTRRNRDAAVHRQFVNRIRRLLRATLKPNTGAMWFDMQEIKAATQNFSGANLIGEGSFGTVYKGLLRNGQMVAVKRITNCSAEGDDDFLNEVEIINNIRHRNLVDLRGCCVASDYMTGHQRFLIYDYMPNGSLDEHLFGRKSEARLSWPQRKNIVLGTAKGLAYLHRGVQPAIYHRDIKPVGIMCAHVMVAYRPTITDALKMLEGDIEIPEIRDRPLPLMHRSLSNRNNGT